MKKILCILLCALLLTGCRSSGGEETSGTIETEMPTIVLVPDAEFTFPEAPAIPTMPAAAGETLAFENPGKVRLSYTGNRSYVKYITSVEELPDEEALQGYDEAFFETKALILVVETVSSGSVRLEIESIVTDGDTATVTLSRAMPGDVGTADMATWLLWAEVSRELDYNWILEGSAQRPAGETA